jgi:hypothetical protein
MESIKMNYSSFSIRKADSMSSRRAIGFLLSVCLLALGCGNGQSLSGTVWTARPEFHEIDSPQYNARIEPQKGEYPYYAFFLFTLRNLSDTNIVIDWNASRYMFDGKPRGPLVFEGIDPATIKSATIPPQTVAPGKTFTCRIMPLRLIAWSPLRQQSLKERSITPGMFPAGENAVRIVLFHTGRSIPLTLSFQIIGKRAP